MSHERVVSLLRSHRVRIARALVRQTRALAPRYEQLDQAAQERNFVALLLAVETLVEKGVDTPVLDQVSHLAQMRAAMGFRVDDFVLAGLAFLPVLRRFVIENSKNVEEGLDDYETLEAIALPFVGRAASIFLDAAEDPTVPNANAAKQAALLGGAPTQPQGKRIDAAKAMTRLRIERVTGTEEEEETYRNHPLFSSIG
jgi:hypothetical protein